MLVKTRKKLQQQQQQHVLQQLHQLLLLIDHEIRFQLCTQFHCVTDVVVLVLPDSVPTKFETLFFSEIVFFFPCHRCFHTVKYNSCEIANFLTLTECSHGVRSLST
jgi:hypothetical protein